MSGIEVVGLVLAAIPLVISGLEHYAGCVKTMKTILNPQPMFDRLLRLMQTEKAIFREMIGPVIRGCVTDRTYNTLMDNLGGTCWSEPTVNWDLHIGLERKLQQSYGIFMQNVISMNTALNTFKSHLQLSPDGKGPFQDA
ncbi:hypothetical protein LTR17_025968 [Elasticomyces elasticus]|nr:hypothetical protein LTR17_025968 [Elasticomyces elasticus]